MLPRLVAWQQHTKRRPVLWLAFIETIVVLSRLGALAAVATEFPLVSGIPFDAEVLNRTRAFPIYWKIYDMWLPKDWPGAHQRQAIAPFR